MIELPLARKALLVTFLAIVVIAATIHGITYVFVLRHVEDHDREHLNVHLKNVEQALRFLVDEYAHEGRQLAEGRSLYAPTEGPLRPSQAARVDYTLFDAVGWTEACVFGSNGEARWCGKGNPATRSVEPLSPNAMERLGSPRLTHPANPAAPISGLAVFDGVPHVVVSLPMAKFDESPGTNPDARLVYTRSVDEYWLNRLRQLTATKVWLHELDRGRDGRLPADVLVKLRASHRPVHVLSTQGGAKAYAPLMDLTGTPTLVLEVETDLRSAALIERILDAVLFALGVGGLGLLLGAAFATRHGVIAPLSKLRDAVHKLEQGHHSAVILERRDEFGDLASGFNRMARTIRERETTLRQAHAELKLILDSTADALCGCTLTGGFRGRPSAMGPRWFGEPQPDQDVPSWLFGNQPSLIALFRLGLGQVVDEKLPLPVALDQLPQRFSRDQSTYEIVYRPIREGDDVIGLLIVIKDITAKIRAEAANREARELQIVIGNLVRDKGAFDHFVTECEGLLQEMSTETELSRRLVHLHTLKGACSIFGLLTFSEACQSLEAQIAINAEALNEEALRTLRRSFQSTLNRVRRFAPTLSEKRLSISLADYSNFVELLEKRLGHERLLAEAMRLPLEPGERLLAKLVQQAHRIAQEFGRAIEVEIDDGGLRLVAESTQLLWSALVHGVKNAIEHGIEGEPERLRQGKTPHGNIRFVMREKGHHLAVSIIDDGRGIDWNQLERRAYSSRLPSKREDLMELLFTDGLSTKAETSSISGRGIGLSAIRATCHALGGTSIVYSGPNGIGTELYCTISMAVATHPPSRTALESHSRLSVHPTGEVAATEPAAAAPYESSK
ncbi:MAG: ATP-binding protein [Polyangiaceae bacterium]